MVKICPICSSEAPPDTFHSIHYGGYCCFSCRAFFRRACQTPKQKYYKCKRGGNCVITPKSQQLCKRCRYDKCIVAKMNPNNVMTVEEKKVRFQHYYKKKAERASMASQQDQDPQTTRDRRTIKKRAFPRPSATVTSDSGETSGNILPQLLQQSSLNQQRNENSKLDLPNLQQLISVKSVMHQLHQIPFHMGQISRDQRGIQLPCTSSEPTVVNKTNHPLSINEFIPITNQIPLFNTEGQIAKSLIVAAQTANTKDSSMKNIKKKSYLVNGESQNEIQVAEGSQTKPNIFIYKVHDKGIDPVRQFPWANGGPLLERIVPKPSAIKDDIVCIPTSTLKFASSEKAMIQHGNETGIKESQDKKYNPLSENCRLDQLQILNSFIEKSKTHWVRHVFNFEVGSHPTPTSADFNSILTLEPKLQMVDDHLTQRPIEHGKSHEDGFQNDEQIEIPSTCVGPQQKTTLIILNSDQHQPPINKQNQDTFSSTTYQHSDFLPSDQDSLRKGETEQLCQLKKGRANSFPVHKLLIDVRIFTVVDAFAMASGDMDLDRENVQEMILIHQYHQRPQAISLISQLSSVALILKNFAGSLNSFKALRHEDQMTLLRQNIQLYLQYTMARYFNAETGKEQINWALEGQLLVTDPKQDYTLNKISLADYDEANNLFETPLMLDVYQELSRRVSTKCPLSYHFNGLVANAILFYTSDHVAMMLLEPERVKIAFEEAEHLLLECFSKLAFSIPDNLLSLFDDLNRMKLLFNDCHIGQAIKRQKMDIPMHVRLQYTTCEDQWINDHFQQFERQQMTVTMPSHILDGIIKHMLTGNDLAENCFEVCYALLTERNRRSFKICSQLLGLSFRDEESLWRKNCLSAAALGCLRVNALKTGKEQLKFTLGILDQHSTDWENEWRDSFDLNALHTCYFQTSHQVTSRFDEYSLAYFMELLNELSGVVVNDHIYKLFVLVTLLDTECLPNSHTFRKVVEMRQIYFKFFHRKLTAAGCTFEDYASFRKTQKRIKIFATMLENFLG